MNNRIPIFPLNLVVFPNSKYPLHIFEERYKRMITYCLNEETGFGILTNFNNEFSLIGTYVKINRIINKYENGEMDIIVEGKLRFKLLNTELHSDGYYFGNIEVFNDTSSDIDETLLKLMQDKFNEILNRLSFKLDESFWNNYKNAAKKSFKLAEKSGLTIEQQQQLLNIKSENERMTFLIAHFKKLDEQLSESAGVKKIVLGNGYLNN